MGFGYKYTTAFFFSKKKKKKENTPWEIFWHFTFHPHHVNNLNHGAVHT